MQEHYKTTRMGITETQRVSSQEYTICLRRKTLRIPIEIIIEELYYHGYDMF